MLLMLLRVGLLQVGRPMPRRVTVLYRCTTATLSHGSLPSCSVPSSHTLQRSAWQFQFVLQSRNVRQVQQVQEAHSSSPASAACPTMFMGL